MCSWKRSCTKDMAYSCSYQCFSLNDAGWSETTFKDTVFDEIKVEIPPKRTYNKLRHYTSPFPTFNLDHFPLAILKLTCPSHSQKQSSNIWYSPPTSNFLIPLSFSEIPKQKPRDNGFHELFKSLSWIQGDNGWWCFLRTKTMIIARWCHSTSNHFVVLGKAIGQTGDSCHIQLGTSLAVNWVGFVRLYWEFISKTVIGSWVGMVR